LVDSPNSDWLAKSNLSVSSVKSVVSSSAWIRLSGETGRILVNGVEVTNRLGMGRPDDVVRRNNYVARGVWPGGRSNAPVEMAEVRIWNVARSQAEIPSDMNRSLVGVEPGLMAYYRMAEGAGMTAFDANTNHLSGTLMSRPAWVATAAS
jgi:hypothetical protein